MTSSGGASLWSGRRTSCRCAAKGKACPQTAVEWLLGQKANPVVQCKVEQVKAWIILWRSASEDQRQVLLKAWRKAARSLSAMSQKQRWKNVTGPITATIAVLLEDGWRPALPHCWTAPQGDSYAVLEDKEAEAVMEEVLAAVEERASEAEWARAAHHFQGQGLEQASHL